MLLRFHILVQYHSARVDLSSRIPNHMHILVNLSETHVVISGYLYSNVCLKK